jgi:hypothetical protein
LVPEDEAPDAPFSAPLGELAVEPAIEVLLPNADGLEDEAVLGGVFPESVLCGGVVGADPAALGSFGLAGAAGLPISEPLAPDALAGEGEPPPIVAALWANATGARTLNVKLANPITT